VGALVAIIALERLGVQLILPWEVLVLREGKVGVEGLVATGLTLVDKA
jgi:hypothetical protein